MQTNDKQIDLSDYLSALLNDIATVAASTGQSDAEEILATDLTVQASFTSFCAELKEVGGCMDMALVEFGPVKGEMRKCLTDPNNRREWPIWKIIV